MDSAIQRSEYVRPIVLAAAMTVLAEAFYLAVWGMVLFPGGSLASKFVWTLTCGIAMGSVIGAATVVLISGKVYGMFAILTAALIFFIVGSACAVLCSRIDAHLGYFGGEEHATLFVLGGVIPAAFGALLYGWLLFSKTGRSLMGRFEHERETVD